MKAGGFFSRQITDFTAYFLIPVLSLFIPASLSRRMLHRVSGWGWLLRSDAGLACAAAQKHLEMEDRDRWKQRFKEVELTDVRDLYMLLFGRSGSVLKEIECPCDLEVARDRVMVGMHWGPAISLLKFLQRRGYRPAFPFRPPERQLLWARPFYYLFNRLATSYLYRTLGERAVPVGGAGKVLQQLLDEPGSICVLMDAPPMPGRGASGRPVLGTRARFNTGFPAMMAERGKEYVLYAMNLRTDPAPGKTLEISGPFRAEDAEDFLDNFAGFLDRHLATDSPHWRIWRAEHQFWER